MKTLTENKKFLFTFVLSGSGKEEKEALQDAIDCFFSDIGEPQEIQEIQEGN